MNLRCEFIFLELLKAVEEGGHPGVELGVPDQLEPAGPVQGQVLVLRQNLAFTQKLNGRIYM